MNVQTEINTLKVRVQDLEAVTGIGGVVSDHSKELDRHADTLHEINERTKRVETDVAVLSARMTSVETTMVSLDTRMTSVETTMVSLDTRMTSLETKMTSLDAKVMSLDVKLDLVLDRLGAR